VTSAVTGLIVVNQDGTIASDESKFVVDLSTLQSDQRRRDNFIKNNTLQTNQYPNAEFVPTSAIGLPSPLPASGSVTFQLVGDLTIRDTTRPTTWDVTAQIVDGRELVGTATTSFTFADFGMTQPRVPIVLSVEDNIRLELDFRLVLEGS
jgi:polyisoprenoid-binding protein YceI